MKTPKKRYGKLTILGAEGSTVSVQCECGAKLTVARHALMRGDHKSCGHGACKAYNRAEHDPSFVPRKPRAITLINVRRAWASYHHKDVRKRLTMEQLAAKYEVPYTTLCGVFNAVRKCGGIDQYVEKLT